MLSSYLWNDGPSSSSCRCHRWHRFSSLVIAVVVVVAVVEVIDDAGLPSLSSKSSFFLVIALPSLLIELIVLVVLLFCCSIIISMSLLPSLPSQMKSRTRHKESKLVVQTNINFWLCKCPAGPSEGWSRKAEPHG